MNQSAETIEIIQFNCNGIRARQGEIRDLIRIHDPKVILLQELKMRKGDKITFKGYTIHIDIETP